MEAFHALQQLLVEGMIGVGWIARDPVFRTCHDSSLDDATRMADASPETTAFVQRAWGGPGAPVPDRLGSHM